MTDFLSALTTALSDRYVVDSELGRGGMAVVYLAEDLKHHRKVAVKVLRPELSAVIGAERFLREIEIAAGLTHPHILPLHDSGRAVGRYGGTAVESQSEFLYYVMPYVEGESLRARLARERQLPVDEAVSITQQAARALEYAHGEGVVHRDIKPENILLHRGEAMVADFGIALAVNAAGVTRLTETGLSIGTPEYMSPEQASGDRNVDGRTDIYSLGCVLYEMLVGEAPYRGPTSQAIIAKVLTEAPQSIRSARDTVPSALENVVLRSLAKLAADRFGTAQQFADALDDPGGSTTSIASATMPVRRAPTWRMALQWVIPALLAVIVGILLLTRSEPSPSGITGVHRWELQLPMTQQLGMDAGGLGITRDGSHIVLTLGGDSLLVHDMTRGEAQLTSSAEGAIQGYRPFLSPDGEWVAYGHATEPELRRVPIDGGTPITIVDGVNALSGGTWGPQNTIVYVPFFAAGLWMVPVEGGPPVQLTAPDPAKGESHHYWPQFLPGGNKVLFTDQRVPLDSARIEVVDLETGVRQTVIRGGRFGRYVLTGHILFMRHETLWAAPFDVDRLEVTGPQEVVLEDVAYQGMGCGGFAVSDNGTLVYVKASVWNTESQLVWVDRDGAEQIAINEWSRYRLPTISPDGERVAVVVEQAGYQDIWVHDLFRPGSVSRVTRNEEEIVMPVWTPDGQRIVYGAVRTDFDLFWRDWAGSTPAQVLDTVLVNINPRSISPDGTTVLGSAHGRGPDDTWDLWLLPLDGSGENRIYRATEYLEADPALSPDGRWVAYASDESGQLEIWLQSYPDTAGARRQISFGGGQGPLWGVGGELFYKNFSGGGKLMRVQIDLASGAPGVPETVFEGRYDYGRFPRNYDVSPDGRRFLMVKPRPISEPREVTVVLNWFEELNRIVPGARR